MRYIFNFPDLGEGLEEGTILEWYVTKGQQVNEGDPLVQMETDKVVADIPSPRDGIVAVLHGNVGDVIKVGTPLVEIETTVAVSPQNELSTESNKEKTIREAIAEGDDDASAVVGTMEVADKDAILPASSEAVQENKTSATEKRKALATPVARAMAKEMDIDINLVPGSGPSGRVKSEDILNFKKRFPILCLFLNMERQRKKM